MNRIVVLGFLAVVAAWVMCCSNDAVALDYTLTVLSGLDGSAEAINDAGIVVGSEAYLPRLWDTRAGTATTLSSARGSAVAVSELGDVAGHIAQDGSNWSEAFRWTEEGGAERLGLLPGAVFSKAYGINDLGHVVGYSSNASNWNKAFIATGATVEELVPQDGWRFTHAMDIDNRGIIVGTGGGPWTIPGSGIRYDSTTGTASVLSTSGWYAYSATEITENGIISGRADDRNHSKSAAYWYDGMLHATVNLGGLGTEAFGTNERGDLVGNGYRPGSHDPLFFVYVQGQGYRDITSMSGGGVWHLSAVKDINNHGQIVGTGAHTAGRGVAVLLTPTNFVDTDGATVTQGGGIGTAGGSETLFSDLTAPGTLNAVYATRTASDLIAEYGSLPGGLVGDETMQLWLVDFSGTLGAAEMTFAYDETLLPFPEEDLRVSHWTDGGWDVMQGVLDVDANTITISTSSFSPFVLTPVPEPGLGVLSLGFLLVLKYRARRTNL